MHFTWSACGPFTKHKERTEKFMQTRNTDFIYKNELEEACFQHDKAFNMILLKRFIKRTQSDKVSKDKAFKIVIDPKYYGYQRGLNSMDYKFFDKNSASLNRSSGSVVLLMNQIINLRVNFTTRFLENLKEIFIHLLESIFGAFI